MSIPEPSAAGRHHGTSRSSFRLPRRVFVGSIASPQTLLSIKIIKTAVLGVGTSGVIRFVEDLDEFREEWEERNPNSNSHDKTHHHATTHVNGIEEDRSSTPVPIPPRQGTAAAHDDDDVVQLPSPALRESTNTSSHLSELRAREDKMLAELVHKHGWNLKHCEVIRLEQDSFLCPGFIDTHTHAPQVPNLGLGQQYELLDWLQYVTFPRERRFEDTAYARRTYESVIKRMINSGTTCAAIYATLHEEATMILADICNEQGLRALVGKCQMDRNSPVDYIEKNVSASMDATKNFINYCRDMKPFGSQTPEEARASSASVTSSSSPEMEESLTRLRATMSEILEGGGQGQDGAAKKTVKETETSAVVSSSKTNDGERMEASNSSNSYISSSTVESDGSTAAQTSSTSTHTSVSSRSSSVDNRRKDHITRRQNSMGSSTSSIGRRATTTTSKSGTDSPRRQKEREREQENANALVQPILTPRFAISCSDALLTSISALMSRDPSLRLQTHLSENEGEIEFTKKLFPFSQTYTDVYDHFSLLTPRSILAHAIHLSNHEMELICKRKCGISHCPTSNNNLRSGASRVGEMLNRGIKVGLGTDMSGGFGMSILSAIREASVVAKVLGFTKKDNDIESIAKGEEQEDDNAMGKISAGASVPIQKDGQDESYRTPAVGKHQARHIEISGSELNLQRSAVEGYDFCKGPLSVATLFYLATLGGAEVCNLAHRVGSLEVGKEFDALLINTANGCPNLYIEDDDEVEEKLEKMLFCGDDRNIASVFVRGRVIGGSSPI